MSPPPISGPAALGIKVSYTSVPTRSVSTTRPSHTFVVHEGSRHPGGEEARKVGLGGSDQLAGMRGTKARSRGDGRTAFSHELDPLEGVLTQVQPSVVAWAEGGPHEPF